MMGWKPLIYSKGEEEDFDSHLRRARRTKFVVDENLGLGTAQALRDAWGANVEFGPEVGLEGKDDTAVFAYAWRKKRVLLTHDRGFLDDSRFPESRNPGVVILPGGSGEMEPFWDGLQKAMLLVGRDPAEWRGKKITIGANGEVAIKGRIARSGAVEIRRYMFTQSGPALVWEDE
jgi:predicted nuclease of predicted toxin-antitoxin system